MAQYLHTEPERLAALRGCQLLDTPPEPRFDDIVQLAAALCDVPIALVSLVAEERQWFKARVGLEVTETPRDISFCAHAILHPDAALIVPDATLDARFAENPLVSGPPFVRFYAGVPLVTPAGEALGTLCVIDRVPRQLSLTQIEGLRALARQAEVLIEMRKMLVAREQSVEALRREIAERNAVEESLQMMRFSVDRAGDSVFWIDREGRILYANDAACEDRGYTRAELLGMTIFDLDPNYQPGVWEPHFEELRRRGSINLETRHCGKEGRVFPVEVCANYVNIGDKEFNFAFVRDITERREAEANLWRQRQAMDATVDGIGLLNEAGEYLYLNRAHATIFGYEDPAELLGKPWRQLYDAAEIQRIEREVFPQLQAHGKWEGEAMALRRDGGKFHEGLSLTALEGGGLICVCRDVTVRKQQEDLIKASLREKEVLLTEVHHRVKNNLQIVSSMLNLRARSGVSTEISLMLRECQGRIRAMSILHETLYRSDSLAEVDLGIYLQGVVSTLRRFQNSEHIQLHCEIEPMIGEADTAIPLGLIVNELTTNAFKHGFPHGRPGSVTVCLHHDAQGGLDLEVRDDGVGPPAGFDPMRAPSFGLRLVQIFVEQLHGELTWRSDPRGTAFRLRIGQKKTNPTPCPAPLQQLQPVSS